MLLVKKRRKRRWLYKKASSDSSARDVGINLRNAGNINSTAVDVIAAEEKEKTASPTTAKETVFFCRTSVYLKRHVAAILIQTAFRGCLVISILFTSIALMLLYHLYFCISYTSHVSL